MRATLRLAALTFAPSVVRLQAPFHRTLTPTARGNTTLCLIAFATEFADAQYQPPHAAIPLRRKSWCAMAINSSASCQAD